MCLAVKTGFAQALIPLSVNKGPDSSWMNQEMPYLKLSQKKFTLKRRLIQNMVTRFNSYYNARIKLEGAIESAAELHTDNYDTLLSLFPYNLLDFVPQTGNLDSAIFDASYGIEIHDPRSKWIDNLYLIAGQAYFFKQDYRNAIAAFKFIIKNGGSKDAEGQPAIIGSIGYNPQKDVSIATPEQKKLFYHTPSRNDAFIWLIRSYIDSGEYTLAGNLINTLKSDPAFPARLQSNLLSMESSFYFRQQSLTKGMSALEKAIDLENDKKLRARWNYILAQYYQDNEDWQAALNHYNQVINLSAGPLMHFYAYLNQSEIRILKNKENFDASSLPLLKMARKEKYARYSSIIYFRIAQLALKSGLPDKAIDFLKDGLKNNPENVPQRFQSVQLLANIYYEHGLYRPAKLYYDTAASLLQSGISPNSIISIRKAALGEIVNQLNIIDRQDSLQRLASMPSADLMAFLKKVVKDSLRAQRIRNMFLPETTPSGTIGGMNNTPTGETAYNQSGGGGQQTWYFYNAALKAKGFSIFRSQWGKRPLTDNWRMGNNGQQSQLIAANKNADLSQDSSLENELGNNEGKDIKALLKNIPLQPKQKKQSDDSIINAFYNEAAIFDEKLENDTAAANLLVELSKRYPGSSNFVESYYRLYLLNIHRGNMSEAGKYRQLILQKYPDSKYASDFNNAHPAGISYAQQVTTQLYTDAYLNYLGGDYEKVLTLKDSAMLIDPHNLQKSRFDLLSAMVLIKQQSDSAGKIALEKVITGDKSDTAITEQAAAILNAVNHKQELIEHLAHLQLPEGQPNEIQPSFVYNEAKPAVKDMALAMLPTKPTPVINTVAKPIKDTAKQAPPPPPPPITPYKINAVSPQFVVLAFNLTQKSLIDECLNNFSIYNQKMHARDSIEVSTYLLANNRVILIFRLFPNELAALKYYHEIKGKAITTIIPNVSTQDYTLFIISRDNFILLNNSKDYSGYLRFFSENYR
ncbi:MAG: tetratricopeptide repeat protein [Chitinophagaceae bacterium]